jgi:hypothetical protein
MPQMGMDPRNDSAGVNRAEVCQEAKQPVEAKVCRWRP